MRSPGSLALAMTLLGTTAALAQSPFRIAEKSTGLPTVTPAMVACTDVPTSTEPRPSLRVLAGQAPDLHEEFAAGEVVVLTATSADGLSAGQRFFVRRAEPVRYRETISSDTPGAIHTVGWATVIAGDEHSVLARIDYACDAVRIGDYLEPFAAPTMAEASGPDGMPTFENPARVVIGRDRREQFGAGDIFSVSRGTAEGLTAGTRVVFYRDRANGSPLVWIGDGHVIAAESDSARVLVTRAIGAVRSGDLVTVRGR